MLGVDEINFYCRSCSKTLANELFFKQHLMLCRMPCTVSTTHEEQASTKFQGSFHLGIGFRTITTKFLGGIYMHFSEDGFFRIICIRHLVDIFDLSVLIYSKKDLRVTIFLLHMLSYL